MSLMDYGWRPPWPELGRLFGGDSFQFQFHLRPGRTGWLAAGRAPEATLRQRQQLLGGHREEVFVWSDAADGCWREVEPLLEPGLRGLGAGLAVERERACRISGGWAPDFVLLRRGAEEFEFVGGSVCFPSAWDPREKLGLGLAAVHGPVPGLNARLGLRIAAFLDALEPGRVFERENWGLAATGELDLHPVRGRPRLTARTRREEVWFRLEEQAFVRVSGNTLLFLIHVRAWPLAEVLSVSGAEESFLRMRASMPAEVARYKGLESFGAGPAAD